MNRRNVLAALMGLGLTMMPVTFATAQTAVKLANIDWPPYNGKDLKAGGATSHVVAQAFAKAGITVTYEFFPFNRAASVGLNDAAYAGYLTEYEADATRQTCNLSAAVGRAPVVFIKRRGHPFQWAGMSSLNGITVGVVSGYVNDAGPLDDAIAQKRLNVDATTTDLLLLRKVASGRNDVGVMDANVFAYLTSVHRDLAGMLVPSDEILKDHTLHVCFAKTALGESMRDRLDQSLKSMNLDEVYSAYFSANSR